MRWCGFERVKKNATCRKDGEKKIVAIFTYKFKCKIGRVMPGAKKLFSFNEFANLFNEY